jgi:hypothetical protein
LLLRMGTQPQLFPNSARTGITSAPSLAIVYPPRSTWPQTMCPLCTGPFTRRTITACSARDLFFRLETYNRRTPMITGFHSLHLSGAAQHSRSTPASKRFAEVSTGTC